VQVILSQGPTVPVLRWVRYKLRLTGVAVAPWNVTFRILGCGNPGWGQ
jgi:hypothetical protein